MRPRALLFAALVALGWLLACESVAAPEGVMTLRHARIETVAGASAPQAGTLELPLHWDLLHPGVPGRAEVRLEFEGSAHAVAGHEVYRLFIARLGNAYEIELNGVLLRSAGSLADPRDRYSSRRPVSLQIPSRLLSAHNELRIRIRANAGARAGVSPVLIGPASQLADEVLHAEVQRVVIPQAISVFSLLVACFCALLWWQQRDALYAWAGLGEALWALTVADTVIESAVFPAPWWGLALLVIRAAWGWSLYAIAREVFGGRPRAEHWTMLAVQASAPLCVTAMLATQSLVPLAGWYAVSFAAWVWVIVRLFREALRVRRAERWVVVVALASVLLALLRDVVAARMDGALYDESAWAKYVSTMVGLALMWIVSRRFLAARSEAIRLSESLARQVERKEAELRASFARLSELERSRAVLAERERILRDMHDGVGSGLAAAVRQVESGRAPPAEVLKTLRESIDRLKLSIDALNLPPGDVTALLASLRYRMQPRIESAGLAVDWNVDEVPRWSAGSEDAMRNLQFILLEVLSNVLQHSGAMKLSVAVRSSGGEIEITIVDDGRGVSGPPGNGLRSMHARAKAIGAVVTVAPAQPGTRVSVVLAAAPS